MATTGNQGALRLAFGVLSAPKDAPDEVSRLAQQLREAA